MHGALSKDPAQTQLPLHNKVASLKQEENNFITTLQPPCIVTQI